MNQETKGLKIGNVELDNRLILAPMAGVTDLPFRLLCREHGVGLIGMEMVSAKAIYYKNQKTEQLLEIHPKETPVSLQLFGSDPEIVSEMAKQIEDRPFSILDINMGCPVPKVVNNGEGSALLKDPKRIGEIVRKTAAAIQKPVTVKIRKGFDEDHVNAVEVAKVIEDAGGAAITVHGRTREQYYSGNADWEIIARVKEAVSIPVIGNGDVTDAESARRMFELTGCDGIMIARAARGNPWVFEEIRAEMEEGVRKERPSMEEMRRVILRHCELQMEYKGEYTAVREMRKHIGWYTVGLPHSAVLRKKVNEIETMEELRNAVEELFR